MEIDADDVTLTIDGREVVRQADLTCRPGNMTALVGASGSGKTTLLHCLGLLQPPSRGRIRADGIDTSGWRPSRRRRFWRDRAAFVLQDHGLLAEETVAFNVTMSATVLRQRVTGDLQRMRAALDQTGLKERADEPAAHLSGGEKQRLAVARAIYKRADVIYVDEPTASLDDQNRTTVIELFAERARQGCTVVISTHDDKVITACAAHFSLDLDHATEPAEPH